MTADYDLRETAQHALTHDSVQRADYHSDGGGYYDGAVIELVIVPRDTDPNRVPPAVLGTLANRGVGIREVTPQGSGTERHYVVVAS